MKLRLLNLRGGDYPGSPGANVIKMSLLVKEGGWRVSIRMMRLRKARSATAGFADARPGVKSVSGLLNWKRPERGSYFRASRKECSLANTLVETYFGFLNCRTVRS